MGARNCLTCPLDTGFKDGAELRVCGSPTPRCANFRGQLLKQVPAWDRLVQLGEIARKGRIELEFLKDFGGIMIYASKVEKGFNEKDGQDRVMSLTPIEMQEDGLRAEVKYDSYNKIHPDFDDAAWAIPEHTAVVLHGAYKAGKTIEGEIHAGLHLAYTAEEPKNACAWRWGMLVQEVTVWDKTSRVWLDVFGTDLNAFRPPSFDV